MTDIDGKANVAGLLLEGDSELLNGIQGSLAGVLLGDCLGKRFGNKQPNTLSRIKSDLDKVIDLSHEQLKSEGKMDPSNKFFPFTDDTQMTLSVARFLVEGDLSDYTQLARRYVQVFEAETKNRGYGPGAKKLLTEWSRTNFENPLQVSLNLFKGKGSFGNGCGMKIAPAALYTVRDDLRTFVGITNSVTTLTHSHPQGMLGGIFQALAIRIALTTSKKDSPTALDILNKFENDFNLAIDELAGPHLKDYFRLYAGVYLKKLGIIRKYIEGGVKAWSFESVRKELGNLFAGPVSIPAAFFCFLASFETIPEVETDNQFLRTILLTIHLGGDADTITSMAAAICGAYSGLDSIPENLYKTCEAHEEVLGLAQDVYDKVTAMYADRDLTTSGNS